MSINGISLYPVKVWSDILENISFFLSLQESNSSFYTERLQYGRNFIVHYQDDKIFFIPSNFVGYQKREEYINAFGIESYQKYRGDGRKTTQHINKILKAENINIKLEFEKNCENEFIKLCNLYNVQVENRSRKFWLLRSIDNKNVKRLKRKLKGFKYTQDTIEKDIRKYHVDLEEDFEQYLKSVLKIHEDNIHPDIDYIDFVYETEKVIHLVELKPYASQSSYEYNLTHAVGQILRYKTQYIKDYNPKQEIKLQIVMKGYENAVNNSSIRRLDNFEKLITKDMKIDLILL
jgi:hypothetical protein